MILKSLSSEFRLPKWGRLFDSLTLGSGLLALLSFLMTALGVFTKLRPNVEKLLGNGELWVSIVLAIVFSSVIQLLIVGAWTQAAERGFRKSRTQVVVGLIMSVASWYWGAAGWHLSLQGGHMLAEKDQAQVEVLSGPIVSFAEDYSRTAADISVLSEKMERRATEEAQAGGTCGRPRAEVETCGPACRLRRHHAAFLKSSAVEAQAFSAEARKAAAAMMAADTPEEQAEAFAFATRLAESPVPARVGAALGEVALELSGSVWRDPETGKRTTCRDPGLADRARRLAEAAAERPAVPVAPPRAASVDVSDSAACLFAQLRRTFDPTLPACGGAIAAMSVQGGIEVALLVMLIGGGRRNRRLGLVESERRTHGWPKHAKPDDPDAVAICRSVMAAVRTNVVVTYDKGRRVSYLFVEPHEDCPGALLEQWFDLDEPRLPRVRAATVAEHFECRFGNYVNLHVLDQQAQAKIKLARDVVRESGPFARRQSPPSPLPAYGSLPGQNN